MPRIKERRRRKRIDVALALTIGYNEGKITAKTKNISLLGTYIEINKEIPVGTKLNIEIDIPLRGPEKSIRSGQANSEGVVFRSKPLISLQGKSSYGTGIFFRSFSQKDERMLANYIDYVLLQEKKTGKIFMRKRKGKLRKDVKQKGGVR